MIEARISNLSAFFQERRVLLWVCQPYDLSVGELPHEYDLPENDATLRYRQKPTATDAILSSLHWEAIWLEGVQSPLLKSLRDRQNDDAVGSRKLVLLASEADAKAVVNTAEFLPVFALGGTIDEGGKASLPSRYDPSRRRTRDRVAWDLASRLVDYPRRLMIVIGSENQSTLPRLYDVLSERPILDLTIVFIVPEGGQPPASPPSSGTQCLQWNGTVDAFAKALSTIGAPKAGELSEWAIRVGKRTVKLQERDVARISESFAIVTEKSLMPANQFTLDDLHAFLAGNLDNWRAYTETVGLPVDRAYRSASQERLSELVLKRLQDAHTENDLASFYHIQLPCESGSGASTILRQVAFRAAQRGFPALVFRPDRIAIVLDEVTAFASSVIEASLEQGTSRSPVFLLVFDVQHESITDLRKLGPLLAGAGRTVVILQAVSSRQSYTAEITGRNGCLLSVLRADANAHEVSECRKAFAGIATKWHLDLTVPDENAWTDFSVATRFVDTPTNPQEASSSFWVALWFFLTQEMDSAGGDRFRDALGNWIQRRTAEIASPAMRAVLDYVAVLSSFRLPSPLWSVLRPATGGSFSSDLTPMLKQLEGVVEWGPMQQAHEDQTLRFLHPVMALEFLRQKGIREERHRVELLRPLLESLSTGHLADVWLSEVVATEILAPKFEERFYGAWDWRIAAFQCFPAQVSRQSKTILHHWARCLYLSADQKLAGAWAMGVGERRKRLCESIDLLKQALIIPQRYLRDEHPSHLYNTLGTAYSRLATLLESGLDCEAEAKRAWQDCCKNFEESIRLSGRTNVEALLAFAKRRMDHWRLPQNQASPATNERTTELVEALSLLDEAQELVESLPTSEVQWEDEIAKNKVLILHSLNTAEAAEFLQQLKTSATPDLGYYCHAQLLTKGKSDPMDRDKAISLLLMARSEKIPLGHRSLHFLVSLLRMHPEQQYEHHLLRSLYIELEGLPGYTSRPFDHFWHAVICYQIGEYREGAQRFSKLRELSRSLDNFRLRVRAVLLDPKRRGRALELVARVTRVISDWRAEGFIDEIGQKIHLRPRHWSVMPKIGDPVRCVIRFEANGPLAVPPRFEASTSIS